MTKEHYSILSEHIFEVRYRANSKILDYRGKWAELISDHLALPHWSIVENRIDIFDKPNSERAFVGFRNSGYTCGDPSTSNFFPDKAIKFYKFLSKLDGFVSPLFVERIGIKSKFITAYESNFEALLALFTKNYISIADKALKCINAKLVDIGALLNFSDKIGNFNTVCGPMKKEQMKDFMPKRTEYPEVGLFYDIDYWQKPNSKISDNAIAKIIQEYARTSWVRYSAITSLILEG